MIVLVDNYDSFTYNLYQYMGEFDSDIRVFRNDEIDGAGILALNPDRVVISPGPKTPEEAGNCIEIIKTVSGKIPLMGVCLGHQSIVMQRNFSMASHQWLTTMARVYLKVYQILYR